MNLDVGRMGRVVYIFGDLDFVFKVTATFCNVRNFVSGRYLLNQWTDFDQTCIDAMLGGCNDLIRFW